jgi:hypothetical protein
LVDVQSHRQIEKKLALTGSHLTVSGRDPNRKAERSCTSRRIAESVSNDFEPERSPVSLQIGLGLGQ